MRETHQTVKFSLSNSVIVVRGKRMNVLRGRVIVQQENRLKIKYEPEWGATACLEISYTSQKQKHILR